MLSLLNNGVHSKLEEILDDNVKYRHLLNAMYEHHEDTGKHSYNVGLLAVDFAMSYGLPHDKIRELSLAAVAHDIGKLYISPKLLSKTETDVRPGNGATGIYTDDEWDIIMKHPIFAEAILKNAGITDPETIKAAKFHHLFQENYYPKEYLDLYTIHKKDFMSKMLISGRLATVDVPQLVSALDFLERIYNPSQDFKAQRVEKLKAHFSLGYSSIIQQYVCQFIMEQKPEIVIRQTYEM